MGPPETSCLAFVLTVVESVQTFERDLKIAHGRVGAIGMETIERREPYEALDRTKR